MAEAELINTQSMSKYDRMIEWIWLSPNYCYDLLELQYGIIQYQVQRGAGWVHWAHTGDVRTEAPSNFILERPSAGEKAILQPPGRARRMAWELLSVARSGQESILLRLDRPLMKIWRPLGRGERALAGSPKMCFGSPALPLPGCVSFSSLCTF